MRTPTDRTPTRRHDASASDSLEHLRGTPDAASAERPAAAPHPIGLAVMLTLAVSLVMAAFLWPTVASEPKDIPIVAAGQGSEQITDRLAEHSDGRFDVSTAQDRGDAVDLLERREAYGAIVVSPDPQTGVPAPEVLVASAASPAVAQSLRQVAPTLKQQLQADLEKKAAAAGAPAPTVEVPVTDVTPLSDDDPTGAGLAAAGFPLVLGGMLGGVGIAKAVRGTGRRIAALTAYVTLAGVAIGLIMQSWFGILQGELWQTMLAAGLAVAAVSLPIAGLTALLGTLGLGLGAATFMLFANPISSSSMPTQFLPAPWGAVGQAFPPGASAHLLRSLSYFPEAATGTQWWTLALWAVSGLALLLLGGLRGRRG